MNCNHDWCEEEEMNYQNKKKTSETYWRAIKKEDAKKRFEEYEKKYEEEKEKFIKKERVLFDEILWEYEIASFKFRAMLVMLTENNPNESILKAALLNKETEGEMMGKIFDFCIKPGK